MARNLQRAVRAAGKTRTRPGRVGMVFSSVTFLFLFLPTVLLSYFLVRRRLRNGLLLLSSLIYYAWGEATFLPVVLAVIAGNYLLGLGLHSLQRELPRKLLLGLAVAANIGLLLWFKYANFAVSSLNDWLGLMHSSRERLSLAPIALPLGISFFTFHALSYVVDVYRRDAVAQRSLPLLCLYLLFFPQLVAGPIVRYHEISAQLSTRTVELADFAEGVERFIVGLAKKLLIANVAAEVTDGVFAIPPGELNAALAWLGAASYAIQIYFDFSGYSDMAIGLARLFGFGFPENFDYPYVARSMTEFWRRWHVSLSRFFRDYLYLPLGGNRRGRLRTYVNLGIVFLLCGVWHGASWNFLVWGALHGALLVCERIGLLRWLERSWSPLRHVYCLTAILITWVFFRAPNLGVAGSFLRAMAGFGKGSGGVHRAALYLDHERLLALGIGMVGSTPALTWLGKRIRQQTFGSTHVLDLGKLLAVALVAVASAIRLSAGTYNPFIYFRF